MIVESKVDNLCLDEDNVERNNVGQASVELKSIDPEPLGSHARIAKSSKLDYLIVALAVVTLCILYQRMPGSLGHPLDDSYISLHSAQVLHWGNDPNFPNTPPLVGITNAPYVLLLWGLLLVFPPLIALEAASWLGILCYALGLVALGRAFRLPLWAPLALAALGLTIAKVPYQLLNGVETGMAMAITVWILALAETNTASSRRCAAVLCGVAPFLRPELIAVTVLVMLALLFAGLQAVRKCLAGASRLRSTVGAHFRGCIAVADLVWSEHGIGDSSDHCSQTVLFRRRMRTNRLSLGGAASRRTAICRSPGRVYRVDCLFGTQHSGALRRSIFAALLSRLLRTASVCAAP